MISLAYDGESTPDGLGAQIQRIYTIYAIGRRLKLRTTNLRVSDVLIHHQDGALDVQNHKALIENTNNYLESLFGENKACPNPIRVPLLTNRVLFKYLLKYGLRPKRFTLITNNPFPVTSKFQNILNRLNQPSNGQVKNLTLHIRSAGNKPDFILKNERQSRNINPDRYLQVIEKLYGQLNRFNGIRLRIFTDSIEKVVNFSVPSGQERLWIEAGYEINEGKINFEPNTELESLISFLRDTYNAEIVRGGDPLDCLQELVNSDILVMSRSSLSYAAGLIGNHSVVYMPIDFWHFPLKHWKTF